MDLYPICDCYQDTEKGTNFDEIVIYYYTSNPSRPHDGFDIKKYKIPLETPLFLCKEIWKWNGTEYEKIGFVERIPEYTDGKPWVYRTMKKFINKFFKFFRPTHEFDFSHRGYLYKEKNINYQYDTEKEKASSYYNLDKESCRWNRAWLGDDDSSEDIARKYGKLL